MSDSTTRNALTALIAQMEPVPDRDSSRQHVGDLWWYDREPPFDDFNKELVPPGANKKFPDGAVGVRCDDDFWAIACLPWEFRDMTIQEIVSVLWPNIETPQFGPDVTQEAA